MKTLNTIAEVVRDFDLDFENAVIVAGGAALAFTVIAIAFLF
jgi:hypothetical protein